MKRNNLNIFTILSVLLTGMLLLNACKEEEETYPRTRLFQPVTNEDMYAELNTIVLDLAKMKEAESYTIEVSEDSFETVLYTFEADTNFVVINEEATGEELWWYSLYQVRVTAHADDPAYDSKPSFLGSVRTAKYPSNMNVPGEADVTDIDAKVSWVHAGEDITHVKVYASAEVDRRLTNPLMEFEVSDEEEEEGVKILSDLEPATSYQIALYSGETLRGWEFYTTKAPLQLGDKVVDLRGHPSPETILEDTLPDLESGTAVILERGKTYSAAGYDFDKSLYFVSGYAFIPELATIECSSNFDLADGSTVDSVVFKDIRFEGDFGGNYVFNIDNSGTIGEIKFDGCRIHSLRGITRIKGGAGTIDKYTIINSVADSINGYAVFYVDTDEWTAGDVLLKNSTFSKCQYFLASRSNTGSIRIEDCTINEAPEKGRQMFRWRGGDGQNNVTNGITIVNTIWGHGWNMAGEEDYAVKGAEGLEETNFTITNVHSTSQFSFSSNEIPGFPNFVYPGTGEELWTDPYQGVDFSIEDKGFSGRSNAGDPRWRDEL